MTYARKGMPMDIRVRKMLRQAAGRGFTHRLGGPRIPEVGRSRRHAAPPITLPAISLQKDSS